MLEQERVFLKLLPQTWNHITVFLCCSINIIYTGNKEAQTLKNSLGPLSLHSQTLLLAPCIPVGSVLMAFARPE